MTLPRYMTESSLLFENVHLKRDETEFDVLPSYPNYTACNRGQGPGLCHYTRWEVFETFQHLEYDRRSTFHVEKFTLCKFVMSLFSALMTISFLIKYLLINGI